MFTSIFRRPSRSISPSTSLDPGAMGRKFNEVYLFKVALKDIMPAIWRRIQVPANYSFWDLHVAIQDAMGWLDYHLHAFRMIDPATGAPCTLGIPFDDDFMEEFPMLTGWEHAIADYFTPDNMAADYEYDFGDGWQHDVVLEAMLPRESGIRYPICVDGRRACPPEDCGGIGGYADFLKIIGDPTHEEHESMVEWVGGSFDPEHFDASAIAFDHPGKRWRLAFAHR